MAGRLEDRIRPHWARRCPHQPIEQPIDKELAVPGIVRPVTDERDALLAYLAQQRSFIKLTAYGLTDDQARATPSMSRLSVGEHVKHVAHVEGHWIDEVVLQQPAGGGQDDYEANFALAPGETLASVFARYDAVARHTE